VLRQAAGGALNEEEISRILSAVSLIRQYDVSVFFNHMVFREAVSRVLTPENKTFTSVVFSCDGYRRAPIAAIVTSAERNGTKRAILVLAQHHTQKGTKTWTKMSKAESRSRF
jgi:hypothetical protein